RSRIVGGEGQDHTEAPHPLTLLRVCSRAASPLPRPNNLHEITSPHCHPRSKTGLVGSQLPSSKQKIASSETGSMPSVHCRNPQWRMSQVGHERFFCDVCRTSPYLPKAAMAPFADMK